MTALSEVLFGMPLDPRPIAGVLFGAAPAVLKVQPGAVPTVGGVILPVPGPPGPKSTTPGPPGPAGAFTQQKDVFHILSDGAQTLHLSRTPAENSLSLFINGVYQIDLSDAQISGATISLGLVWQLFAGDTLAVQYGYLP